MFSLFFEFSHKQKNWTNYFDKFQYILIVNCVLAFVFCVPHLKKNWFNYHFIYWGLLFHSRPFHHTFYFFCLFSFLFQVFFRFKLRGIIIVSVNELDHNTLIYLELNKRLSFGDHLKGTKSRRCHRKKKQLIHNLGNIYTFHQLVSIGISERCKTTILYWFCSRPNHWLGARFVVVLSCALALSPIHYYVVVVNVIRTQCFPFVSLFHSTEWQSTFWWPLPWPMPTDILWRSIYFSCLWNFLS